MKQFKDPVTGDSLTRVEYISWRIQSWVRSPWFQLAFNLISVAMFLLGLGPMWNYFASWLAVEVEWVVGKYAFGQMGRDAVVLRRVDKTLEIVLDMNQRFLRLEERLLQDVEHECSNCALPQGADRTTVSQQPGTTPEA